ncbi:MAG TPA: haloacid dehalogenase type II [Streptosporangiaceae bacterium]|nr:haloacid dehalogenase type II [Streptosporangiaceae bacterium]
MDIEIVAFDVFGTLVDWRTSITAELSRIGERRGLNADWAAVADAWRSRYAPTLTGVLRGEREYQSLDVLHAIMLDEVIATCELQAFTEADRDELVLAWYRLRPWPDTVPGLTELRKRHILTPLSNGGLGLLTRLARAGGMPFDCILSAELASSYKPDPQVYLLPSDYFDVPPERVLMVACHPGDLQGAKRAGLRTGFVPRPLEWGPERGAPQAPADVDVVADDLVALAALI